MELPSAAVRAAKSSPWAPFTGTGGAGTATRTTARNAGRATRDRTAIGFSGGSWPPSRQPRAGDALFADGNRRMVRCAWTMTTLPANYARRYAIDATWYWGMYGMPRSCCKASPGIWASGGLTSGPSWFSGTERHDAHPETTPEAAYQRSQRFSSHARATNNHSHSPGPKA